MVFEGLNLFLEIFDLVEDLIGDGVTIVGYWGGGDNDSDAAVVGVFRVKAVASAVVAVEISHTFLENERTWVRWGVYEPITQLFFNILERKKLFDYMVSNKNSILDQLHG